MPNWIEGSLKVRGNYENVKRFFLDGTNDYTYQDNNKCESGRYVPRPKEEYREVTEYEAKGNDGRECIISWHSVESIYIEDTKRAFIDGGQDVYICESKDGVTIGECMFRQAWSIEPDNWVDLSKKYDVDIRLWGLEGGMQFGEELEVSKGEITICEVKNYDTWTMPLPWMGG